MRVAEFRPLFADAWEGEPPEVRREAWRACFNKKGNQLLPRVVTIYRILKNTKPPYLPS